MPGQDPIQFWNTYNLTRGCWNMGNYKGWTHTICSKCWSLRVGNEPVRTISADVETCCFCGAKHTSGIFVRENPESEKLGFCECESG